MAADVRFLGIDLAWGEGSDARPANRSGVVALQPSGEITAAGWTIGLPATVEWLERNAHEDTALFVDAPLVITNLTKQRLAEKQVGQRYGSSWVSANSTNLGSKHQAGVRLRERLEQLGWTYSDGFAGPNPTGRHIYECYPYTTLVGVEELGYDDKRPAYKRKPKSMRTAAFRPEQRKTCDELIARIASLEKAQPPIDLMSHQQTAALVSERSPENPKAYKQREDLLDAAICAWTAALWQRDGLDRCQVLGGEEHDGAGGRLATIIAPARQEQRRDTG